VRTVQFLIRMMSRHDLHEIDLREGDLRIRLLRGHHGPVAAVPVVSAPVPVAPVAAAPVAPAAASTPAPATTRPLVDIKSEGVGTFYVAPGPGEAAYVSVGSRVTPTTMVGQIEAMKVFSPVTAGCSGVVVEVVVKNEDYVDFGQVLFRVDPAG
jgi:acetyl-CoA carboxylase biotin carboxyl carrier protein